MADFQIIGAGVAGLCVATEALDRGLRPKIHDPNGPPGPHCCSWWAGGMLAPECESESAEELVVRLGREAVGWWRGKGVDVAGNGTLVLALERDQADLRRFARLTNGHRCLDAGEIAALEPDLGPGFRRGLFFPEEGHLDPRAALGALADRLRRGGVEIDAVRGDADMKTVDCRGLAARDALKDLRGVKGEMLILRCPDIRLSRPVRLLHPRNPVYVVPRADGIFMVGATMIESAERSRVTARSLLELLTAAYALNPAFGEAEVVEIGVDSRPAFSDNLPRIRRRDNVIYVNGLFRHGFLLAPMVARMTVDLLLDGVVPEVMDEDIH